MSNERDPLKPDQPTALELRALEAEFRAFESNILLARATFMREAGITFQGQRDEYDVLGYDRQLTLRQYREEYQRGGIAGRIIDVMPDACWRGNPAMEVIENEDPNTDTPFEQAWNDLEKTHQICAKLQRVDRLSRLSTYAVLLIGAAGDLDQELPKGDAKKLLYLMPFTGGGGPNTTNSSRTLDSSADCSVQEYVTDAKDPRFGLPLTYNLRRTDFAAPDFKRPVHWTRVVHIAEGLLDNEVFGQPALERVWNLLADLRKVTGGGAEAFWLRANQGLHLDIDKDLTLSKDEYNTVLEKLKEQSELYKHQLTRWLKTRGVNVQTLGSDVANFANPADAILTQIAGAKAIPKRILTGSEMGELASSQDRENFRDQINGRQTQYCAPYIVRPLVDRLIAYGYLLTPAKGATEYQILWPHIQVLTEDEKADGAQKWASTNATQGEPVFTDAEIRDKWYGMEPLTDAQRQEIADRKAEALAQQQAAMMPPPVEGDGAEAPALSADDILDVSFDEDADETDDTADDEEDDETPAAKKKLQAAAQVIDFEEAKHPRGQGGQFGSGGGGATGSRNTPGQRLSRQRQKQREQAAKHDERGAKKATREAEKAALAGARASYKARMTELHEALPDDEKKALHEGYEKAKFKGSELEFLRTQLDLYQTAKEGDKRLKTWFSSKTVDKYLKIRETVVKKAKQTASSWRDLQSQHEMLTVLAEALETGNVEVLHDAVRHLGGDLRVGGDLPGHPFHGNQYTSGTGGRETPEARDRAVAAHQKLIRERNRTEQVQFTRMTGLPHPTLGRAPVATPPEPATPREVTRDELHAHPDYLTGQRLQNVLDLVDKLKDDPNALGKLLQLFGPAPKRRALGDVEGHPFHGNQWTEGHGGGGSANRQRYVERWPHHQEMDAFAKKYGEDRLETDLADFWANQAGRGATPSYEFQVEVTQAGQKRLSNERREAKKAAKEANKPKILDQMRQKYGYDLGDTVHDKTTGTKGVVKWGRDGQPYVQSNMGQHLVGARWEKLEAPSEPPPDDRPLGFRKPPGIGRMDEPTNYQTEYGKRQRAIARLREKRRKRALGGAGSGNFGHSGRPGEVGGSGAGAEGIHAVSQAAMAPPSGIMDAIQQADGGFTYHAVTGAQPTTGYALSLHPDREQILDLKDVNLVTLATYAAKNRALLAQTDNYLGAWHNPADGKVYLDVSTIVTSPEEAERRGALAQQYAYFDLAKGQSVKITSPRYYVPKTAAASDRPADGPADLGRPDRLGPAIDGPGADRGGNSGSHHAPRLAALGAALVRALVPWVGPLLRPLGSAESGNYGHAGRPGQVGGSAPSGSGSAASVKKALSTTPVPVSHSERIGGDHANAAFRVTDPDGHDYLFKPSEGEARDIHDDTLDYDDGPGLAEREVLAAQVGQALGLEDLVPNARLGTAIQPPEDFDDDTGVVPPPPAAPPAADPNAFELVPPESRTPPPEHSGVIQTTIGGLRADQRYDAWGRPIWFGVSSAERKGIDDRPGQPGNLVNDPTLVSNPPTYVPSESTPSSVHEYDEFGERMDTGASSGQAEGDGALIDWVENARPGYGSDSDGTATERANLIVFDTIIGNKDRHGANYMMTDDGRMVAIDHGYSFPSLDKTDDDYGGFLRNYMMGGYGMSVPDPGDQWGREMASRVEHIDWDALLRPSNLTEGERRGVVNRAALVVDALRSPARLKRLQTAINWRG